MKRTSWVLSRITSGFGFHFFFFSTLILANANWAAAVDPPPDAGCLATDAWLWQSNPRTDAEGIHGHAYPEWNATYWGTRLEGTPGSVVTIRGRFPMARYMSFQAYDDDLNVLGGIDDVSINPDPGENNPYIGGTAQGTYTVRMIFGRGRRNNPPPNTFYTSGVSSVILIYRIYYSNNPDDLTAGAFDPVLPELTVERSTLATCASRPILTPEEATLNGRLNDIDFGGNPPAIAPPSPNPPRWTFHVTNPFTPFVPSQDNAYMYALISRAYLSAPYTYKMVVIRMRPPTFPDTQAGVPPYANADVRFWSMCQDEPLTTSVVYCVPDNRARADANGFVTFVITDPSFRPSDTVLNRWSATWIPWGALQPNDVIYDLDRNVLTNADGVFYYGGLIYRQTTANPSFAQSIENIAELPNSERRAAMGDYWPAIGYCAAGTFEALGAECINR